MSAAFILVNSIAGLAGLLLSQGVGALPLPAAIAPLAGVVLIAAWKLLTAGA